VVSETCSGVGVLPSAATALPSFWTAESGGGMEPWPGLPLVRIVNHAMPFSPVWHQ
jgi:hypothetical protein